MPNFDFASMAQVYGTQKPKKDWLKDFDKNKQKYDMFGNIISSVDAGMPSNSTNKITSGLDTAYDTTSSTLMATGNPYAMAAGAIMKGFSAGDKALAQLTNGATTFSEDAKTGTFDSVANSKFMKLLFPGIAYGNAITKTTVAESDKELQKGIVGYAAAQTEKTEIGGMTSMFSKKDEQAIKNLKRANTQNILASTVSRNALKQQEAATNMMPYLLDKNKQKLQNLFDPRVLTAKQGTKLSLKNIKAKVNNKIKKANLGMKFDEPNVIVDGAFHSRKHNMDIENLTPKGVPVIMEEGGEITQTAEVERNELIFNLKTTQELEKLYKKFKDGDENAALEAGKLLTYEILENTNDNTNLLNTI